MESPYEPPEGLPNAENPGPGAMPRPGPAAPAMAATSRREDVIGYITEHGFVFGAAYVSRLATLPGGRVVIGVQTPRGQLDLYVTPGGHVRIFEAGPPVERTADDGETYLAHGPSRGEWARPSLVARLRAGWQRYWVEEGDVDPLGRAMVALHRLRR